MERQRWMPVLLVIVAANLVGGIVFTLDTRIYPSWVVYPTFLIIGSIRLLRGRGTTGIVFLGVTALVFILVHLPFTPFGAEGSECEDCTRWIAWTSLTVLPLALFVAALLARRDVRRSTS